MIVQATIRTVACQQRRRKAIAQRFVAATSIQSCFRSFICQHQLRKATESRCGAATTIQRASRAFIFRRFLVRRLRECQRRNQAARIIQSARRSYLYRVACSQNMTRRLLERQRLIKAAAKIQSMIRSRSSQLMHRRRLDKAAALIQAKARSLLCRQTFLHRRRLEKAATSIQAKTRSLLCRRTILRRQRWEQAATSIQAKTRSLLCRRAVLYHRRQLEQAATSIQAAVRCTLCRHKFLASKAENMRDAVLLIQQAWRAVLHRRKAKNQAGAAMERHQVQPADPNTPSSPRGDEERGKFHPSIEVTGPEGVEIAIVNVVTVENVRAVAIIQRAVRRHVLGPRFMVQVMDNRLCAKRKEDPPTIQWSDYVDEALIPRPLGMTKKKRKEIWDRITHAELAIGKFQMYKKKGMAIFAPNGIIKVRETPDVYQKKRKWEIVFPKFGKDGQPSGYGMDAVTFKFLQHVLTPLACTMLQKCLERKGVAAGQSSGRWIYVTKPEYFRDNANDSKENQLPTSI
jgi:IQ calmodulin-binding motif